MTFRMLKFYMRKNPAEQGDGLGTNSQKEYLTNPLGPTEVIGSKADGRRRTRMQKRHGWKRCVEKDTPEPEMPSEKPSSSKKGFEKKCPACNRLIKKDADECPFCTTRFYKRLIACQKT